MSVEEGKDAIESETMKRVSHSLVQCSKHCAQAETDDFIAR